MHNNRKLYTHKLNILMILLAFLYTTNALSIVIMIDLKLYLWGFRVKSYNNIKSKKPINGKIIIINFEILDFTFPF